MATTRGYPQSAHHQASPDSGVYTMPYMPSTPHHLQQPPVLMQNAMMMTPPPSQYYGMPPPAPESYTEQWLELAQQLPLQPHHQHLHQQPPAHLQQPSHHQQHHFEDARSSVSSGHWATTPSRARRRLAVNAAGRLETDAECEQRVNKAEMTKASFASQLAIKEQLEAEEAERSRRDLAKIEYERRCLETRAALEAELELNKWKVQEEEEQRRSEAILTALDRARKEAAASRRAKLHRHVSQSDRPAVVESPEENHTPSPRYIPNGSVLSGGNPDRPSSSELTDSDAKSTSPLTVAKSPTPPSSTPRHVVDDDRPLRPATRDPLLVWQEVEASLPERPVEESPLQRSAPNRSTLRARPRTTNGEATKTRRTSSTDRQTRPTTTTAAPTTKPHRLRSTQTNALGSSSDPPMERPKTAARARAQKSRSPTRHTSKSPTRHATKSPARRSSPARDKARRASKSPHRRRAAETAETTTQRPARLLSRRPTLESMLNGAAIMPKLDVEPNPWGDELGGSNPLMQPMSMRRRRNKAPAPSTPPPLSPTDDEIEAILSTTSSVPKTTSPPSRPQSRASNRSAIPSTLTRPVDKEEGIGGGLLLAPTRRMRTVDDSSAAASPVREFGFKRGPLHQSLSAKRRSTRLSTGDSPSTPSERQTQILSQLARLRENLASKQRTMETTYSQSTAFVNAEGRYSGSNASFTNRDAYNL